MFGLGDVMFILDIVSNILFLKLVFCVLVSTLLEEGICLSETCGGRVSKGGRGIAETCGGRGPEGGGGLAETCEGGGPKRGGGLAETCEGGGPKCGGGLVCGVIVCFGGGGLGGA